MGAALLEARCRMGSRQASISDEVAPSADGAMGSARCDGFRTLAR